MDKYNIKFAPTRIRDGGDFFIQEANKTLKQKADEEGMDIAKEFTLVISVHERNNYAQNLINYYYGGGFPASIIIVDSSSKQMGCCPVYSPFDGRVLPSLSFGELDQQITENKNYIYDKKSPTVIYCPSELYYSKMYNILTYVSTPYVCELSDDDLIYIESIFECINFLRKHKQYDCCDGFWNSNKDVVLQEKEIMSLVKSDFFSSIPQERLVELLNNNWKAINHSVIKTEILRECYKFQLDNECLWPIKWWDKILMFIFCFIGNYKPLAILYGKRRDWGEHRLINTLGTEYPKQLKKEVEWKDMLKDKKNYRPLIDFCCKFGFEEKYSEVLVKNIFAAVPAGEDEENE